MKRQLALARDGGDNGAIERIQHANGLDRAIAQSGTLTVVNGSIINSDAIEPPAGPMHPNAATASTSTGTTSTRPGVRPSPLDVVTADDEIIQGSLCVGLDCVVNESFGFDTVRLKENNTRIKFDDTSTSTGFPNNDWQLTANDSASGGANKFSIDDVTGSKTPFTIIAGAPTNSLFVASSGKVGFGNASPVLNLHITATDTPAIRQEQTNGGGFTAQTWDIGANEANWFVRDVTGGSRLPLRIRPGAPTSSIDISASGSVGVGTASPAAKMDIQQAAGGDLLRVFTTDVNSFPQIVFQNAARTWRFQNDGTDGNKFKIRDSTAAADRFAIDSTGNVGIGTKIPAATFDVVAGGTTLADEWTTRSSRCFKTNIRPLEGALDKIEQLQGVAYERKVDGKHEIGVVAEDVY